MPADTKTIERPGIEERERVLRILRQHERELRAQGVVRLRLFGSIARGEAGPESDVDLLAEMDAGADFSLVDLVGLQHVLAPASRAGDPDRHEPGERATEDSRAHREGRDRGLLMAYPDLLSRLEDIPMRPRMPCGSPPA
jgi:predicted nucleotidyltransferase